MKIRFRNILNFIVGVTLLFVCSQSTIPLKPIPITLQTFGVMLLAIMFKRNIALAAVSAYLLLGAIGVPVFANFRSGLSVLLGPTGGYLWGFLVAVALMSTLKKYLGNNLLSVALNGLFGTIVIVSFGVMRLRYSIGLESALNKGLYPFILPAIIKILLLVIFVWSVRKIQYSLNPSRDSYA